MRKYIEQRLQEIGVQMVLLETDNVQESYQYGLLRERLNELESLLKKFPQEENKPTEQHISKSDTCIAYNADNLKVVATFNEVREVSKYLETTPDEICWIRKDDPKVQNLRSLLLFPLNCE